MRLHSGKRNTAGKKRFLIFRRLKSNCPTQRHESHWKKKIRAGILFSALRSSLWSVDNVAVKKKKKIHSDKSYCLRKKTSFSPNLSDGHEVFRNELKSREHTHECTVFMHQNKTFYVRLSRKNENDTDKSENDISGLVKVNISGAEAFARWKRVVPSAFIRPEFDGSSSATEDSLSQNLTQQTPKETHFAFFLVCRQNPGASLQVFFCLFVCFVCFRSCWEISFFKFININNYFLEEKRHKVLQHSPDSKSLCFVCLSTAVFLWLKLYSVNTYSCLL